MADQEHYRKLERMYARAPVNEYFAPELRVSEGRAEVRFEVRPDFHHAAGAAHGSVCFKALDDAAFFAVNSLVEGFFVLTVSFNLQLLRPVSEGQLCATGKVVHRSPRLYVADAELADGRGRLVARGSGSFLPGKVALGPDIGYR